LFVIEEALAVPPAYIALMDEIMTAAFNPKRVMNHFHELPPFTGKKMLFLVISHYFHLLVALQYMMMDVKCGNK